MSVERVEIDDFKSFGTANTQLGFEEVDRIGGVGEIELNLRINIRASSVQGIENKIQVNIPL